MSKTWTDYIWTHSPQSGSAKLLLLAIADLANDNGSTTEATTAMLAKRVGTKERNIQYLLRKLEGAGELRCENRAGSGGYNRYTLLPAEQPAAVPCTVQPIAPLHVPAPSMQSLAPLPQPTAPVRDAILCTTLRKERRIEGGDHTREEQNLGTNEAPAPTTPLPGAEPSDTPDPLTLWQRVRAQVHALDAHQLQALIMDHDRTTDGQGAYWVTRAILSAIATNPTFANNDRALNLVRAILARWQREQSYGSDTPGYQQRAKTTLLVQSTPPLPGASPSAPRGSPLPAAERAVWRTATTSSPSWIPDNGARTHQ